MVKIKFDDEPSGSGTLVNSNNNKPPIKSTTKSPIKTTQKRVYYQEENDNDEDATVNDTHETHSKKARRKASKNVDFALRAKMLETRQALPIWTGRDGLIDAVRNHEVVVVLGETGSGKTTQLPQFLLESGLTKQKIGVTQPRRVAAMSLAQRVSTETGTQCGSLVGYSVRFDDKSWKGTKLKYLTDGMLMRELLSDALLSQYGVVMIDEAHERTLRTDLIIGTLKSIMERRKAASMDPLKVVIMSATLDAEKFSHFFNNAPVLYVKGRQHPVTIYNSSEDLQDYLDASLKTILQIHQSAPLPGDILVFLPGQEEIQTLGASLKLYADNNTLKCDLNILQLYASLSPSQQQKVFEQTPENTRKVILSTNVAETSITIAGVKHVIDTGLARERKFYTSNGGVGIDTLFVKPISKSAAMQRAGRAGRESAGNCYRLYTEKTFLGLSNTTSPEIERTNLNFAILQLKAISEKTYEEFEWLDTPSTEAIQQANMSLYGLGALDRDGCITELGRRIAGMPLDPAIAKILLSASSGGCVSNILSLCALLSVDSPIYTSTTNEGDDNTRERFASRHGDHIALLNIWNAYQDVVKAGTIVDVKEWCQSNKLSQRTLRRAKDIRGQLEHQCKKEGMDVELSTTDEELILKCVLEGMFQNVALRQGDGTYRQIVNQQLVKIHPTSCLLQRKAPCIMYNELTLTTATYARTVSSIHPAWLRTISFYNQRSSA
ncbi:P-loop containing nucleoside triphosphate hydrolase protein [Wallemia mellicola]|uniref:RNA helicase n=1 Tax=Wallemia mellicola TaxID=1708541 RepID=A0AB38MU59_9BASI|nr:P-loop containing nucleoside triphosphate hydrolase protein [Wallemia mellicola]